MKAHLIEIFVRVIRSMATRVSEWGLSSIIFLMGWGLLAPGTTFDYSGELVPFLSVTSENGWGLLMIGIGTGSLVALWVNGAASKISARARLIFTVARSSIWGLAALIFIEASFELDRFIASAAIYPVFVLMEWAVVTRSAWEQPNAT